MTTEDLIKLRKLSKELTGFGNVCMNKIAQEGGVAISELLDALEALGREVARLTESVRYEADCVAAIEAERDALRAELAELKNDVFSYKVAWETVCDGAKDVVSDLEKTRAELAAIRATQEPVAYWVPKAEQFCIADKSGRPFAKAWEPLYASPAAKDAGLVAVQQWRFNGASDWYDGHPDLTDGGGPYEVRVLYARPKIGGV